MRATSKSKPELRVRTLFFGTSEFAVPSLRTVAQDTDLVGVVTQPDRPAGRGHKLTPTPVKKAALEYSVPIYEPISLKNFVAEHPEPYDLFVLASYGKILPAGLLAMPTLGALNVHPSMLPKYRGATPIQAALLNGDRETGVTIMMMDAGMDTGPIVLQERAPVGAEETYGEVHDRLAEIGAQLLRRAIAASATARPTPQQGEPSVTKPIRREDLQLDWAWTAQRIVNTVRAYAPQPAARAVLHGVPVKVLHAQSHPASEALIEPCSGGVVYITRLIVPNKGAMSGSAFVQYAKAHAS